MQYGPSEEYTRHVDYYNRDERFFGNDLDKFGGQRIKTALLYLTTASGGETVFPKAIKFNSVGENSCATKCAPSPPPHHSLHCPQRRYALPSPHSLLACVRGLPWRGLREGQPADHASTPAWGKRQRMCVCDPPEPAAAPGPASTQSG